jgi:threonine/homoserine/homoserine lactone efflux protein
MLREPEMLSVMVASGLLALSIAVPFGPISLMCVQRSLLSDHWRGLACGAGASTAHGAFASLAFLGAHYTAGQVESLRPFAGPLSGALLVMLGLRIMLQAEAPCKTSPSRLPASGGYITGLSIALCNPATILPYLALSGSSVPFAQGQSGVLTATIIGVFCGSLAWYAFLSCAASAMRNWISKSVLKQLNLLSGASLIVMGIMIATSGLRYL